MNHRFIVAIYVGYSLNSDADRFLSSWEHGWYLPLGRGGARSLFWRFCGLQRTVSVAVARALFSLSRCAINLDYQLGGGVVFERLE